MDVVELAPGIRDQIVAHAGLCAPAEACGLVSAAAVGAAIDGFHPVTNAARSPIRFVLDPVEMLGVERAVEAGGRVVVGVVHSHPTTAAEPSPTDRADAAVYDPAGVYVHLILSLASDPPEIGGFVGPNLERVALVG